MSWSLKTKTELQREYDAHYIVWFHAARDGDTPRAQHAADELRRIATEGSRRFISWGARKPPMPVAPFIIGGTPS